jgi:hypothetical protein
VRRIVALDREDADAWRVCAFQFSPL